MNKVDNQMTVAETRLKIQEWKSCRVAEQTVRSMIRRGQLKATKRGGSVRISVADLEAYFRAHTK